MLFRLAKHRRLGCRHHLISQRRGHHLIAAQLKGNDPCRLFASRRTVGEASNQIGDAAPAREHAEILLSIDFVGHGCRRRVSYQLLGPETLSGLGVVGDQIAKLVALKHQTGIRAQHPTVQGQRKRNRPARFSLDRIPGQQRATVHISHGIERARRILHRPPRGRVVADVPE